MFRTGLLVTKKFTSILDVVHASKFRPTYRRLTRNSPIMSADKLRNGYWMNHIGQQLFSTNSNTSTNANRVNNVNNKPQVTTSSSSKFPTWYGKAEFVVEEVEKVANVVEKVAMVAEKVCEEVAEKFPEDGKLKKATLMVECVSKHVAHDAQLTKEFVHKVDEFKNDLDGLESFFEPLFYKVMKKESERK